MQGLLIACLAFGLGQALSADEKALLDAVWTALQAKPDSVGQHRGYLAFLDTHADIASAEEAYCSLRQIHAFRAVSDAFDEALIAREDVRHAWDRYGEALVRNDTLRAAEDAWYRAVLSVAVVRDGGLASVFYLQTHCDEALRFLDNPARLVPTPEVLYPLRALFIQHPEIRKEWLDTFRSLEQRAAAQDTVFAWWSASSSEYRELVEYLAPRPAEFWAWRRHTLAWADEPHARDWMRHWRGCIRRDKSLAERYDAYVLFLRSHPEWQRAAQQTWERARGASAAWPPEGSPPALGPGAVAQKASKAPKHVNTMPKEPKHIGKPGVRVPDMPVLPERPTPKELSVKPRFKQDGLETRQQGAPQ